MDCLPLQVANKEMYDLTDYYGMLCNYLFTRETCFHSDCDEAKDFQKSKFNQDKTRKKVSVLDMGGKPWQRNISEKTDAISEGTKNPIQCPR